MRVPYRKDDENIQMMGKVFMKKYIIVTIAVLFSFLCANMLFAAAAPRAPRRLPFGLGNLKTNMMGMRHLKVGRNLLTFFQ